MGYRRDVKAGTTGKMINVELRSSEDGNGLAGVAAAAVSAWYVREGAAPVAIAVVAGSQGAWSSGGWVELSGPRGLYELGIPNAALAAGVRQVKVRIQATGALDQTEEFALVAVDPDDGAAYGMSRLDVSTGALQTALADVNADADAIASRLPVGPLASSAEVTAVQNNTRVVRVVPDVIERPDAGTITYRVELFLYDSSGNMEAPDSAPLIELVNQSGTDRSSRLDSTTMTLVEAGRYRAIYTASAGDALEQLVWSFTVTEVGAARKYGNGSLVVDVTAVDFTATDRAKLDALHDVRLTAGRAAALDLVASLETAAGAAARFSELKGAGWSASTDTLEKIRDAIDALVAGVAASTGADVAAIRAYLIDRKKDVDLVTSRERMYAADGVAVERTWDLRDEAGNPITRASGVFRRTPA